MDCPPLKSAILFLIFNRLETTKQVFSAIQGTKPKRLYVASDGPRGDYLNEADIVKTAREYVLSNVDWDCEVNTLFRDRNLGCKHAVSSAVTWFFNQEEQGIIFEDDCLPHPSFFRFCDELLEKYRDDERIMAISGDNFQFGRKRTQDSYYFSRYPHCWGWATWKRAWQHCDIDLKLWPIVRDHGWLRDILADPWAVCYWTGKFQATYEGRINSWAFCWTLACWLQNGLTILPNANLVSNIGFTAGGTHLQNQRDPFAQLPTVDMSFPLQHPAFIVRNDQADRFTQAGMFGLRARLLRKIKMRLGI